MLSLSLVFLDHFRERDVALVVLKLLLRPLLEWKLTVYLVLVLLAASHVEVVQG